MLDEDLRLGCKLGIDSWVDTGCAGKHAHVEEFIIGKTVTATGFSPSLGKLENLPYAYVLYAYDHAEGSVILLEHNNAICMGNKMDDSLSNPIQSEEAGVGIDMRPNHYYEDDDRAQTIAFADGTTIPILYEGSLPFIPIRRHTPHEVENCRRLQLTSRDEWDPYHLNLCWAVMSENSNDNAPSASTDPISLKLMSNRLEERASSHQILHIKQKRVDGQPCQVSFTSLNGVMFRASNSLSTEELSKMWRISLKTAKNTILATTH